MFVSRGDRDAEIREGSFPRQRLIITTPFRPAATARDGTRFASGCPARSPVSSEVRCSLLPFQFDFMVNVLAEAGAASVPRSRDASRAVSVPQVHL